MFTTFKLMRACTNEELLARDLNDIVAEYKITEDARKRNRLIATVFCKLYPMILKLQKKFHTLTTEQKIEHALYHLVKALERYDSKKMKFSSFFHTHLSNQFKTLLSMECSQKRAVFQNIIANNAEYMDLYAHTAPAKPYEHTDIGLINDIKNSSYLSSEEKDYCSCVVAGIDKMSDIAKVLKIDSIESIKKPLVSNPLLEISDKEKLANQEKLAIERVRKIKNSIKKKRSLLLKQGIDILRD